jgi:hypothetical protein
LEKLSFQDINLEGALNELQDLKNFVAAPEHILGSEATKFGEIAERSQVNISNARNIIQGLKREHTFDGVGRTAPEDYLFNGNQIQSKFNNGISNTITAIKGHISDYPDFVSKGGSYDIPKDRYEEIMKILTRKSSELSRSEATLVQRLRELETQTGIKFDENVKPSIMKYGEVQQGKIDNTIKKEEANIKKTDQERRDAAYQESKPSLRQGAQAVAVGAALEGGVSFCLAVVKKRKEGKNLTQFTVDDWKEVGIDTGIGTLKGGIRGASVYALTNFTVTPAAVASGLVTASFGIVSQVNQLRQGKITNEEFIINSEAVCLDVSISAISSLLGQTIIPIPVLGALVGNAAGMFMYGIVKNHLLAEEQKMVKP